MKKKVFDSIEATNMGNGQVELAEWAENYVYLNYPNITPDEFEKMESQLVIKACKACGWASVPQTGGFMANFAEE